MGLEKVETYAIVCDGCKKEVFRKKAMYRYEIPKVKDYLNELEEGPYGSHYGYYRTNYYCDDCFEKRKESE